MRLVFPNSQKINRGNYVIKDIVDACRANDVTDLVIFHEHRGEPGLLFIYLFFQKIWFKDISKNKINKKIK